MRSQVNSSTGYLPIHMLYNKDPIMPFQMADSMKHSNVSLVTNNVDHKDTSCKVNSMENDDLMETVEKLEQQRQEIFTAAKEQIKKSQEHQAKGYNNRQMKGKPFEVSSKVLKLNMHQKSHCEKMTLKYLDPYTIRSHSSTGNYYLTDRYSHWLKKSVPASQLVKFYEKKGSYQKKRTTINNHSPDVDKSFDPLSSMNDSDSDSSSNCKKMRSYQPTSHIVTFTPIKSQIIIMSSKEMPPSSDESEMIDVCSEMSNPFGNINVDEIPIEIVDHLMDSQQDNS